MGAAVDLSIQSLHVAGFSSLMGIEQCPRSINYENQLLISAVYYPFGKPRINAVKRIGPHNKDVIALFIGTQQGDGYAEKIGKNRIEKRITGTRICFQQENKNVKYIKSNLKFLSLHGYTFKVENKQKKEIRIGHKGEKRFIYRFKTYSFSSQNWQHKYFYINNKKVIPFSILDKYFTPFSQAIQIMDDGTKAGSGQRICQQSFEKEEVYNFSKFIKKKYNQNNNQHISNEVKQQYYIYIKRDSIDLLFSLIKPYLIKSMYYKFNNNNNNK